MKKLLSRHRNHDRNGSSSKLLYNRKSVVLIAVSLLVVFAVFLNYAPLAPRSTVGKPAVTAKKTAPVQVTVLPSPSPTATASSNLNLVQYVDPFIGTDKGVSDHYLGPFEGGNVFPGASVPHGMVQWSPDTTYAPGGYRYYQSVINGFSLTHFSGRGCSAYQDFPFMPTVGPITVSPAYSSIYSSLFSHANETASPGYYSVRLDASNIQVALTATLRTGFGRFTYPPSKSAALLINAGGSADGDAYSGTGVQIVGGDEVTGSATSGRFCGQANTYTVYFAAIFDRPFAGFGTWNGVFVAPNSRSSIGGASGAYLNFDTTHDQVVQVRVGVSFVSVANALTNLESEAAVAPTHVGIPAAAVVGASAMAPAHVGISAAAVVAMAPAPPRIPARGIPTMTRAGGVSLAIPGGPLADTLVSWDFGAVRQAASGAWNAKLNQIQVSGGTVDDKRIFYTALYHTLFHPNVFSDVNGQYMGFDDRVHIARGYTQYENFPGWDMYRSLIGLRAILEPNETSDMMQSLVMDAQQGGGGLPRWEVANDNSGGMIGDSIDAVIATSYAFGVRNFDTRAALQAMDRGASRLGTYAGKYVTREGLSDYLNLGYVSTNMPGSASITLEYATDDFAIAQFAKALGRMDLYNTYMRRSQNWKNLFNYATGYIEPRNANGTFSGSFSPTNGYGFVESDGLQYSWMIPYDLKDLFKAMGGNANAIARLDNHFSLLNDGPNSYYAFMGNEPEFEVPWEYDFAGAPYRTQDVVRRIETELYKAAPQGLPGNDDGGAMSSWYVFAAIGLYPEIPGVAGFAVGSPLFPAITVHLGNGNILQINGQGAADNKPYVRSLTLNGHTFNNAWIPFANITDGATLQFVLDSNPNRAWGSKG